MVFRAIILCTALFFSMPLFAEKNMDVLFMKNGDRLTCEIKGLSDGVLSVKLNYVDGAISVQWSQVARMESTRLFLVHTESGEVYTGNCRRPESRMILLSRLRSQQPHRRKWKSHNARSSN